MSKKKSLVGKVVRYGDADYAVEHVGDGPRGSFVWLINSLGAPFTLYPVSLDTLEVVGKARMREVV